MSITSCARIFTGLNFRTDGAADGKTLTVTLSLDGAAPVGVAGQSVTATSLVTTTRSLLGTLMDGLAPPELDWVPPVAVVQNMKRSEAESATFVLEKRTRWARRTQRGERSRLCVID